MTNFKPRNSWTIEDRDYVWFNRVGQILRYLILAFGVLGSIALSSILSPSGHPIGLVSDDEDGLLLLFSYVPCLVGSVAFSLAGFKMSEFKDFFWPGTAEQVYCGQCFPTSFTVGETMEYRPYLFTHNDEKTLNFSSRYRSVRAVLQSVTIAGILVSIPFIATLHILVQDYATLAICLSVIMVLLIVPSLIWHIIIHDLPDRWNPLLKSFDPEPEHAALVRISMLPNGPIWKWGNKIVQRRLFRRSVAPFLMSPRTQHLCFGLFNFKPQGYQIFCYDQEAIEETKTAILDIQAANQHLQERTLSHIISFPDTPLDYYLGKQTEDIANDMNLNLADLENRRLIFGRISGYSWLFFVINVFALMRFYSTEYWIWSLSMTLVTLFFSISLPFLARSRSSAFNPIALGFSLHPTWEKILETEATAADGKWTNQKTLEPVPSLKFRHPLGLLLFSKYEENSDLILYGKLRWSEPNYKSQALGLYSTVQIERILTDEPDKSYDADMHYKGLEFVKTWDSKNTKIHT